MDHNYNIKFAVCVNNIATPNASCSILATDMFHLLALRINHIIDECYETKFAYETIRANLTNLLHDCYTSNGYLIVKQLSKYWRKQVKLITMKYEECKAKLHKCDNVLALYRLSHEEPLLSSSFDRREVLSDYSILDGPLFDIDAFYAYTDCQRQVAYVAHEVETLTDLVDACNSTSIQNSTLTTEQANRIAQYQVQYVTVALDQCHTEFKAKKCEQILHRLHKALPTPVFPLGKVPHNKHY
jgi:hypothetical protein